MLEPIIDADRREAYRYLGLRGRSPDEATARAVEEAFARLKDAVEPKQVSRLFPLKWRGAHDMDIEGLQIESRALAKNLAGCDEVFLMAATLGLGPDRLIARAQAEGAMSRAMALQAASAAMIEAWCDAVNEELRRQAEAHGRFCRPRFSPGYGDFPLDCQRGVFRLLGVQKNIGVTLTASLLMLPTKSVTAVIGLSDDPAAACDAGCAACGKADCAFRDERKDDLT